MSIHRALWGVSVSSFTQPEYRAFASATDAIPLRQTKPRAVREHFIVPSICSRDVACAEWPYIRRFEHLLKLLDVVNDAFNVHASQYLIKRQGRQFGAVSPKTATARFPVDPPSDHLPRQPSECGAIMS